ncbi:MAG TPA: prolyl oligopeptidase family serine peptidase [Candidatus Dormibacteraeota bacterium]|nr:prolyl oligopeptidase family serine peptidase [Candidatus Dormibacteraeota bacterium]
MKRFRIALLGLLAILSAVLATPTTAYAAFPVHATGTIDGAAFLIDIPAHWNGTLLLYSHGYVAPGKPNPAQDAGDPGTSAFLLGNGYALAGSSYSQTGWALQQAFHDQMALLEYFQDTYGKPTRTIAWGHSLGGIITAGLIQLHPESFAGALPMCGVLAGGPGSWNVGLDAEFVFKTLAPEPQAASLQLVNITNPGANLTAAETVLAMENSTAQGQARLALASAVSDTPGWFDPFSPEPAANQFGAQAANQFLWNSRVGFPFVFALRAELEFRAGGNPSWNTGVDYERQVNRSVNKDEVVALYKAAGLDLKADLEKLESAPRVSAKPSALDYLTKYIVFNGDIEQPVLTMHTTGDGLVVNQDEQAYASVVSSQGNSRLLRQVFVHRANHCTFTPAETVTALSTLVHRIATGRWGDSTSPAKMNAAAAALDGFNTLGGGSVVPPAFLSFRPAVFLRPFDARNLDEGGDNQNQQN